MIIFILHPSTSPIKQYISTEGILPIGGSLFVVYAIFGFWIDYAAKFPFRNPLRLSVVIPYVFLYLTTVMFYWWPLKRLSRGLWLIYAVLYVIATILNITSH